MEYQKVFPRDDDSIVVRCPSCMSERKISSNKIPNSYRFNIRCTCNSVFGVQFESRKKYRKDVNLHGVFLKPDQDAKWGKTLNESLETRIKKTNCMITNISMGGIGIKILDNLEAVDVKKGDVLLVKFNLDNSANTEMEKMVKIKVIKNGYLGCQFTEEQKNDTVLKFYFL